MVFDQKTWSRSSYQYGVPTKLFAGLEMEAEPKSANLMQPLSVSKMLPALISR
jgi:hypothetical protein